MRVIAGHRFLAETDGCACSAVLPLAIDKEGTWSGPDICPLNASGRMPTDYAERLGVGGGADFAVAYNDFLGAADVDPDDISIRQCVCGMKRGEHHRNGCPFAAAHDHPQ